MKMIWPLVLCLCACGSLSPMAVVQLMTLSPLETDPAHLAVALELPEGVKLPDGAAFIQLSAKQTKTGQTTDRRYPLLARSEGGNRTIYQVAPRDLETLRQQQSLILGWGEADKDATQGSFSVGLNGCKTGDGPQPDGVVNIFIRTAPDRAFVPMIKEMPWSEVLEQTKLEDLQSC